MGLESNKKNGDLAPNNDLVLSLVAEEDRIQPPRLVDGRTRLVGPPLSSEEPVWNIWSGTVSVQ